MLLNLERLDFLIAQYVSGSLPEPAHVLVGSHLEMQADAGCLAEALEDLSGQALQMIEPEPIMSPQSRLDAIFISEPVVPSFRPSMPRDHRFPSLLQAYARTNSAEIPWKMKLPGLRQYVIERSPAIEATLLWARPGRALPHHRHQGLELTLVLEGEFHDHRGNFREGDVSVADEDLDHRPVAGTLGPCICFSVLFAPIALSGPTMRLFGDILGV